MNLYVHITEEEKTKEINLVAKTLNVGGFFAIPCVLMVQ